MISLLKGHEIIINYHGDPREEFKLQLKSLNYICLFYILDFIFSPSIMKRSNYIIVNSYYMKKLLEKKYTLDNIIVIPNGINEYWFKDEDSSDNSTKILPENIPNIIEEKQKKVLKFIYHGRLAPEKGVNILLSGFKKYLTIVNSHSNSQLNHLTIVGDGPQRKKLERFCHDLDLDEHVSFLGKVSDSQLNNELQNANAAIYPSIYEPFSLAILEAFTKVKGPVVYSKNIGINDFVKKEGYDFITFEPTAQDICNKLLTVAEKQYSKSIPREQQAFAAKYTWKNVTEKYIDTYNKLIET
jgi:glycosyltransferase involved in cell wall biosynthesis